jgi:hypothetical protein
MRLVRFYTLPGPLADFRMKLPGVALINDFFELISPVIEGEICSPGPKLELV